METLFLRVLAVSAAVSLLLLPLPLCRRWLERKYAPQTRWALWLGLALVLLIAPWVPKPQAPVVVETPAYTVTLPVRTHKAPAASKARPVTPAGELVQPAAPESGQTGSVVPTQPEAQAQANARPAASGEDQAIGFRPPAVPLTTLLSVLWLVGLALVLLWQVGCYFLVRRRFLREAKPVIGLERYAAELGLERRVSFYHCKAVPGPMTLGVFQPIVLLPPEGLAVAALCHELYHVKRRDVAYKLLLLSACSLHWFNPLVWLMYRWADRDVEACCDAAVVAGQDSIYKRSYGELLLSAAVGGRNLPFTTSFGGGVEQMKARLTQLFRPGKQSRALVCIVLALAAVLGSLVACRQEKTGELADGVYCSPYANVVWPVGETDAEGEDYGSIRLSLLDYNEIDGPHGKPLGEFTLPLAAEAEVDENWMTVDYMNTPEGRQKRLETFLRWPVMRNSIPAGMDYLVVTVKNGEVTRLSWALVDRDTRYTNETYGFTFRLPEDWFGRYTVREEEGMVWFYQKNGKEGMKPLFRVVVDPISILEPYRSEDDPSGYAWVVSEFAEVLGETEEYLFRIVREPELEWYEENDQSEEAREYREMSQQAWRLGKDDFALISEPSGDPLLTENNMPTLVYYDPERDFLLYRTEDTAYFHYGDSWSAYCPDQSEGRRVLWRCDVSENEKTVYLSDVFDGGEARDQRFYEWDIGSRNLTAVNSIPDGVDHMTHIGSEELFYSGFMNGTSLKSNVIRTHDGTLAGLYVDELIGNTIDYLQLARMREDGTYEAEGSALGVNAFLTPERIPASQTYTDPDWGFTLQLPESLEGNYVVSRAANNWNFYNKELYPHSGYLFSLWAEDSDRQREVIDSYDGIWPGKILGEKDGITYTLTTWTEEYLIPEELDNAGHMAMLRDTWEISADSLDLSGVTRSSGYLWPLPYTEYGSDRLLGEGENNTLRILSPEGVTVQSVAGGRVKAISVHPITGEQTVYVVHPDGWNSEYGHLDYVEVKDGSEIKRGEIIGIAREEEGHRWLNFRLLRGSLWDTAVSVDPWSVEYRTYDFLPVTRDNVTVAGDPVIENTLWSVLQGERGFHNMETGESCFTTALPDSDDVPVTVYRYAKVDMDHDTIPEVVLWLRRGDDIYQLGSIILHYEGGVVYGYPMGYRSMDPETLKADGTYGWSGGAFYNGWGRKDFLRNETVNTVWQDYETFYVDGNSVPEETYRQAGEEQEAKADVDWYSVGEESQGGFSGK